MLKSVIQKKNVNRLLRFKPLPLSETIFSYAKRYAVPQPEFHQLDFIAGSIRAAIATAENRHSLPFRKEFFSEPDHHGSLAGPSNGKVPNTNDRPLQTSLLEPSLLVHPDAHSHGTAIEKGEWPKESAQKRVNVHCPAPFKRTAIFSSARLVAPRLLSTRFRAFSLISFMRCGLRNNSIHATPTSSGLST